MIFIPMSGVLVPETVMAPGPPKAIGKGLLPNAFIAQAWTERYVAGRSLNSLIAGLARQGAELSPATLTGTCAAAGALLAPLEEAIAARSRASWHLHADETTWHVFCPCEGDGPARWWLWVFLGPVIFCKAGRRKHLSAEQYRQTQKSTWRLLPALRPPPSHAGGLSRSPSTSRSFLPYGRPRPVQASHPGPASHLPPLLPSVISRKAASQSW